MEEAGVRQSVLLEVYSDQGHEFRERLCVQGAAGKDGVGQGGSVSALRVPWVWITERRRVFLDAMEP